MTKQIETPTIQLTMAVCIEFWSAVLYTATVRMPIFLALRITRQAISPRLAIRILLILRDVSADKSSAQ